MGWIRLAVYITYTRRSKSNSLSSCSVDHVYQMSLYICDSLGQRREWIDRYHLPILYPFLNIY